MNLLELETAVSELKTDELTSFAKWFEEYLADSLDERTEADILADKLNHLGDPADAEFEAGRCRPLWTTSPRRTSGTTIANCRSKSGVWPTKTLNCQGRIRDIRHFG